ncbi:MAG: hypothetical protein Pg6A_17150 [Termitinemataceae bacterium]|nr:MAG: hypothetical protein Pg6A_17150 [Termitinemataceae bacterium]
MLIKKSMFRLKIYILIAVFIFAQAPLFANNGASEGNELTLGFGVNIAFATIDVPSLGGFLSTEYFFNSFFSAGLRSGFSYSGIFPGGLEALTNLESFFLLRIYFPKLPRDFAAIFTEADVGLLVMHRTNGNNAGESIGTAQVGGAAGVRFFLPRRFYTDVYLRGGWPFLFDAGIIFGYRFYSNDGSAGQSKIKPEIKESAKKPEAAITAIEPVNAEPQKTESAINKAEFNFAPLLFASDRDDLFELPRHISKLNEKTINSLVKTFKSQPEDKFLLIVGTANAANNEDENLMLSLGMRRAEFAKHLVSEQGINRSRLITASSGAAWALVPAREREAWMLNRRVEFVIIERGRADIESLIEESKTSGEADKTRPAAQTQQTAAQGAAQTRQAVNAQSMSAAEKNTQDAAPPAVQNTNVQPENRFNSLESVFSFYENVIDENGAKKHTVKQGETLASITKLYYGRKNYYYPLIMLASGLNDDSLPLVPGMVLVIPNEIINFNLPERRALISDMFYDLARFYKIQGNESAGARMRNAANYWRN